MVFCLKSTILAARKGFIGTLLNLIIEAPKKGDVMRTGNKEGVKR